MKKIIVFVLLVLIFGYVKADIDWSICEKRTFTITAYYSPESDQLFYYKPNFEQEKILNWNGTHWASGKPVFNWMLAAPTNYEFGEKIYFPDLGVGEISDRGWAIVNSGNRWFSNDRLDIRVGFWELWLVRALDFGVQEKIGYYCDLEDLKKIWNIDVWLKLDSIPVFKNFFDVAIWKQSLEKWRKDIWVWILQKYLIKLGYLNENQHTGVFGDSTRDAICSYQSERLISYPGHVSCGVFWPQTRIAMKNSVESKWLLPNNLWEITTIDIIEQQAKSWDQAWAILNDIKTSKEYFDKPFYRNTYDSKVKELQKILLNLEIYEWDMDWVFDDDVISAVYKLQIQEWILKWVSGEESLAWYIWSKTRKILNEKFTSLNEDIKSEKLALVLSNEQKIVKKDLFQFYRPYEKSEWPNEEIRILQRLMVKLDLYTWSVNWVYDWQTIDSVFNFQIKYWILDSDSHYSLHWFLWPSTRNRLNEMLAF